MGWRESLKQGSQERMSAVGILMVADERKCGPVARCLKPDGSVVSAAFSANMSSPRQLPRGLLDALILIKG